MLGAEIGGGLRHPLDAGELLVEDVLEDEVAAGIGGDELARRRRREARGAPPRAVIIEQIAVEKSIPS